MGQEPLHHRRRGSGTFQPIDPHQSRPVASYGIGAFSPAPCCTPLSAVRVGDWRSYMIRQPVHVRLEFLSLRSSADNEGR